MKKGFTLVELLAVITILGLLALLIVPKVQKTIKDSKKNIYESSAYALSREADNFYLARKTELTSFDGCTYDFTDNSNTCDGFEFKGQKPDSGTLNIDKNGNVQFSVKFEKYCYVKQKKSDNITVIPNCTENIEFSEPVIVTSGDGLYESATEPGRLVYRGANPNNYINIKEDGTNNTLYRIVSYEPDGTTKVVRNERILRPNGYVGGIPWDDGVYNEPYLNSRKNTNDGYYCSSNSGCNIWGNQTNTLFKGNLLDNNFYYSYYETSNSTTLITGVSGKVEEDSTLNRYLNSKISDSNVSWQPAIELDKYIEEHSWNVGGVGYTNTYTGGDKGLQREKEEESLYTWKGKIGLLSATEYVESSTFSSCTSIYSSYYYNPLYYYKASGENYAKVHLPETGWPCGNSNWTYISELYGEYTMTPYPANNDQVWVWDSNTGAHFEPAITMAPTWSVRPAFYLKSDTLISGTGTQSDPYRILN